MSKYTYELLEEQGDVLKHKLVKKNVDVEFTLADMLNAQEQLKRHVTEARSQMDVEIAKMKNVEEHHADAVALVKALDPLKQTAIKIWVNAKIRVDELGPYKDKLVNAMRSDQEEIAEMLKQTGLELPADVELPDLNGTPSKKEKDDSSKKGK